MTPTLRVVYNPHDPAAMAVADGWCPAETRRIVEAHALNSDRVFTVPQTYSTLNIIEHLRLARAQGKINGNFVIVYGGEEIDVNEKGLLSNWPQGMDWHTDLLGELLDARNS